MGSAIQLKEGGSTPTLPLFDKHAWEVRQVPLDVARSIVERNHYAAGGSNTATYTHGLFPFGCVWLESCAGVAWWLPPTKTCAMFVCRDNWRGVLSLSRLAVVPGIPKNACSFLIRHSMRMIDRKRWPVLVTFADEWQGHTGTIYRAAGWIESGWTKPERTYRLDGKMVSRKAGPKTRTHAEMMKIGCEFVGKFRRKRFIHFFKET